MPRLFLLNSLSQNLNCVLVESMPTFFFQGRFKSSYKGPKSLFCSTKYCVFAPTQQTEEVVRQAITRTVSNTKSESVDLLQFHWQDVSYCRLIPQLHPLRSPEFLRPVNAEKGTSSYRSHSMTIHNTFPHSRSCKPIRESRIWGCAISIPRGCRKPSMRGSSWRRTRFRYCNQSSKMAYS